MTDAEPDHDVLWVYTGEALARYHFGHAHPFGPRRHQAFVDALQDAGLTARVHMQAPVSAPSDVVARFHDRAYIERVKRQSASGEGVLDCGDTPAIQGIFEAASTVVGTTMAAVDALMRGRARRAFVPIAGLHHARRDSAAGFCVFNDCGVAIETLFQQYALQSVAYVDIDAHHGDGVFYAFEQEPRLIFADMHEDGRFLYPGTGAAEEAGRGPARGRKLNLPLPPGADDETFFQVWPQVEALLERFPPQFVLLQCGADSLAGDPITHLRFSPRCHAHAAQRLRVLAERHSEGRLLAMGGGGYDLNNIAAAWSETVRALC